MYTRLSRGHNKGSTELQQQQSCALLGHGIVLVFMFLGLDHKPAITQNYRESVKTNALFGRVISICVGLHGTVVQMTDLGAAPILALSII